MGDLYRRLRKYMREAALMMKAGGRESTRAQRRAHVRKGRQVVGRIARTAGVLLLLASSAQAITNGFPPASNDGRYDAVGAFAVTWRLGLSFGHADDADHAWFCTATLIDEQTVLTASHCLAAYGVEAPYAVRFRRQTDGSLGTIAGGVASYFHAYVSSWSVATGSQLAYGTLAAPVEHIAPLAVSDGAYLGMDIQQAGWGRQGPAFGSGPATELRLCSNFLFEFVSGWTYYGQPYLASAPGIYENACGANSWDSGAPLLAFDTAASTSAQSIGPVVTIVPVVVGIVSDQYSGPMIFPPATRPSRRMGRR